MILYKFDKKKANKIIALSSAFAITISNSLSTVLAKENTSAIEPFVTGGIAQPYVPANAKLDENNKPVLDSDGDFILLDEEGMVIPKDILKEYSVQPDSNGNIIHELDDYRTSPIQSRASKIVFNNTTHNRVMRSSASTSSSKVGSFPVNAVATLLEEKSGWAKIKYNNKTGWIAKNFIVITSETKNNSVKNITSNNVNIRSSKSTTSSILGKLPAGQTAIALELSNGWFKIIYGNIVGWVSNDYVKYTSAKNNKSISIKSSAYSTKHYLTQTGFAGEHQTSVYMKDSSGRHLYCLDPEKSTPNSHPFTQGKIASDGLYRILKNGYPNKSFTGDNEVDRVITQAAVWAYADPGRIDINKLTAYRNSSKNASMLTHIKNLYNTATSSKETQTVSVKFSKTDLKATFNGDGFLTDYINMVGSGDIKSATTKLRFFDADSGKERTDIKAVLENGSATSSVTLGQKFRLLIPKSTPKGKIKITGSADITHPVAYEYSSNLSNIQDAILIEDVKESKDSTNSVVVNWNGVGNFTLTKIDTDSKAKLKGAQFSVKDSNGANLATLTTDANGIAKSSDLTFGTYKVQEIKAPTGYELDPTIHTVTLNDTTTSVSITHTNKQIKGSVTITKVDAENSNTKLQGAEFTLYDANGKEVKKSTTNTTGIATFDNIAYGKYSIKETKAPEGYALNATAIPIEITTQNQSLTHTVSNSKKVGQVDFSKTDVTSGAIIEGATIQIKGLSSTNKHVDITFVSSKNGNKFTLPVGKYEFKETIAPEGYVLNSEVGTFEIKENGDVVKANLKNTPITGAVQITKVDSSNNNIKLSGAEFTLYNASGKEVSKVNTNKDGIASFSNIPYGEYSIKETKSPNGYVLSDNPINFKISEHNKTLTYTVGNTKKAGELDFSKTDVSTGKLVEGATIEIKGLSDTNKDVLFTFVSSKEGNKFTLPIGKYEFKETIAPQGYVLSTEVGTFEIKSNGDVVKANLKNTPITGTVIITKIESASNSRILTKLKGAEFTLYNKNEKEISKAITNEAGIAKFENIPYGEYTIKETKSPNGYVLKPNTQKFSISKQNETLSYTITNDRAIGEVDFTKTDVSTGKVIDGAIIEIKGTDESNKDIIFSFLSSKEGNKFKLPTGKYEFKETLAPQGYIISEEIGKFEIKENGAVVKANLKNTPITASVELTKVDSIDKNVKLSDAEFTLYNSSNKEISKATTNKNGFVSFDNLTFGDYYIKETKSPNGYILDSNAIHFKVSEHNKTLTYTVDNVKKVGEVHFTKTDVSTGDIIEGATIEIKGLSDTNKDIKLSFVSSKEGNKFTLPIGKYEFKETIAPQGYVLSEEVGTFEIKQHGDIVKADLKNTPITGSVTITKIGSESNTKIITKLKDAEFTLYTKDGKEVSKAVTDKAGIAKFENIPYGEYFIKETRAPYGYVLSDNIKNVSIKNHNEELSFTIENYKAIGEVDFTKTDATTGDVIEGATIEIRGIDPSNEDIFFSFISSKEGNKFKLPIGKYEFKETIAPTGYILSEEVGTFEIKENNEVVKANLKNTPLTATLKITKVDSKNKSKLLAGAEFTLTDKDGKKVNTGTTNKDGVLVFNNLLVGKYTLTETKAPADYLILEKGIEIEVTGEKNVIEIEVENNAKLAQTGGDFVISNLIYSGFALILISSALYRKKSGGIE